MLASDFDFRSPLKFLHVFLIWLFYKLTYMLLHSHVRYMTVGLLLNVIGVIGSLVIFNVTFEDLKISVLRITFIP